jgi:hypothetical protein
VRRIPLPTAIDLSLDPRFKSFNYHELKSKSTWNHLLVGSFTDTPAQLIWIEPRTLHIYTLLVSRIYSKKKKKETAGQN